MISVIWYHMSDDVNRFNGYVETPLLALKIEKATS